jgi:hypothetical protein
VNALSAADALELASVLTDILSCYDLTKNELRLGLVLLRKTFLEGDIATRLDFAALALELGGRPKEWAACFRRLCQLKVVFWDEGKGVVRPNTDIQALSRERALRTARRLNKDDALPLPGERTLDNAVAEVNREAALASTGNPPHREFDTAAYLARFRSALERGTVADEFPETEHSPPGADGDPHPRMTVHRSLASASAIEASAFCTKAPAKLRAEADPHVVDQAWGRLVAVDKAGARARPEYSEQWRLACERAPTRVLAMIKHIEPRLHAIANPWAYLANMARSKDWGVLRA